MFALSQENSAFDSLFRDSTPQQQQQQLQPPLQQDHQQQQQLTPRPPSAPNIKSEPAEPPSDIMDSQSEQTQSSVKLEPGDSSQDGLDKPSWQANSVKCE